MFESLKDHLIFPLEREVFVTLIKYAVHRYSYIGAHIY